MLELVNQYKEAAQLIEAAQAEQELIKAQIKAELAARGTDTLQEAATKSSFPTSPVPAWTAKPLKPLPLPCLSSIPKRSPFNA